MPEQFVVPQFIDAEDTIMGPITARQFVIMMVVVVFEGIFYKIFPFTTFLIVGIPLFLFAIILAFFRVNGMPFHFFLLNIMQTFRRPRLRVWNKEKSDVQLREYLERKAEEVPLPFIPKTAPGTSRLRELTLVVDTGGIYKPDENDS
ncbi:MAG: hypothetical protein UU08_C0002G0010 [Candidatus Uhrbacteria bacterium GW2011_GWE2_40_58]|nr:MAG: hypothetical protein UT94_C0048G0003 [Candidatus Uhrbacteria bacterium GW2011_GWF2_40_263]KKR68159.1 MAG: hypothetical protein UU08_C0002G0010 [Candidatus Uhrbacteria bacterium GW2011_GWE2_40_58]OGL97683.1 MAG: hypothetical protein A2332_00865 [Candidatus Uhrbacteria bacterium RIFOXYB2_FULL_41_18]HBK34698.1 hypothetical protein [Candidatus Uhrbacteria bacterium]HCB55665.1 hypothetical protein [Candidatus Uhrbacteria bacterium]